MSSWDAQTWMTFALLVLAIVTPTCGAIAALYVSNKAGRRAIYDKIDTLHRCVETFRTETARELGEFKGHIAGFNTRLGNIEGRSYRVRATDSLGR